MLPLALVLTIFWDLDAAECPRRFSRLIGSRRSKSSILTPSWCMQKGADALLEQRLAAWGIGDRQSARLRGGGLVGAVDHSPCWKRSLQARRNGLRRGDLLSRCFSRKPQANSEMPKLGRFLRASRSADGQIFGAPLARTTSHQLVADPHAFREISVAGLLDRADVNEEASSPSSGW